MTQLELLPDDTTEALRERVEHASQLPHWEWDDAPLAVRQALRRRDPRFGSLYDTELEIDDGIEKYRPGYCS